MTIQDWFDKRKEAQLERRKTEGRVEEDNSPSLWTKCVHCDAQILKTDLESNDMVCPVCEYHFRINARTRIKQLFDEGTFEELFSNIKPTDPLEFTDTEPYKNRLEAAQKKTNLNDAVVTGVGEIEGHKLAVAIMDFDFMGGSMGSTVGEKIAKIMEEAIERKIPVMVVTSSGGARMQESALSLMQMAKTSCAVARLDEEGILYLCLLTEPTFGGVTASFASLGDIIIAEPKVLIGFAGRRVIEGTIKQRLPDNFQLAEFLEDKGFVDMIVERKKMRSTLSHLLKLHGYVPEQEV